VSISSKEAAAVAAKHGLSLSDAAALSRLAESEDEADELAAMFVNREDEDPQALAKTLPRL